MSKPKTVTVRIAVAVDPEGSWSCSGWSGSASDAEHFEYACDTLVPGERRYILTATLEVPEVTELEVDVERVELAEKKKD